ncbi:unnamed protein product [Pedinophyceae sp. YPF-701]|nr:unnamed protein product [Pedinophyceae sp. YPF-701]
MVMAVASAVNSWLAEGGLREYADNFAGVSPDAFRRLLMQDYGKYGITTVEDKQKLFRLIKAINKEQGQGILAAALHPDGPQGANGADIDGGAQLLDLDAHPNELIDGVADNGAHAAHAHRPVEDAKIRVVVRRRPMNQKEMERGEDDVLETDPERGILHVNEPKVKVDLTRVVERHQFVFDEVLDPSVTNEEVYMKTVQPLVTSLFQRGMSTCFAYGQTGSGKTFTMQPLPIRATEEVVQRMRADPSTDGKDLWVSYFEIYGGKVFDLLNGRQRLVMREDGKKKVNIVGLQEYPITSPGEIIQLLDHGNAARSTGSTGANADSSRSHAILQLALKERQPDGTGGKLHGKISFIDLAGSERGADTYENDKQTRIEGAEINKSLLALKECIRALDSNARHLPFRGSKLTEVLRDSFVGSRARTVMICCVSPGSGSCEHSLNTLRYADRVKELRKDAKERTPSLVTPGGPTAAAVSRAPSGNVRVPTGRNRDATPTRPRTPRASGGAINFPTRISQDPRGGGLRGATPPPSPPRNATPGRRTSRARGRPWRAPRPPRARRRAAPTRARASRRGPSRARPPRRATPTPLPAPRQRSRRA